VPGAIDRLRAMSRPDGTPVGPGDGDRGQAVDDEYSGWRPTGADPAGSAGGTGLSRVVLAAADPAQPYGAALAWPETVGDSKHRPGRKAGALVVLVEGAPALYVERGGRSLLSFTTDRDELAAAAQALAGAVHEGWLGSLAVERADGVGSLGSELADVLTEAGFRVTPKGLRLRA
jgi:ATP-dependent Lhr-like helicase